MNVRDVAALVVAALAAGVALHSVFVRGGSEATASASPVCVCSCVVSTIASSAPSFSLPTSLPSD